MSDILCVTNRILCKEDFLARIEKIAAQKPKGIILREKDLPEAEYRKLSLGVLEICERHNTPCILHSFTGVAAELGCKSVHLPLHSLRALSAQDKAIFQVIGASCHSLEEAKEAQALGCTYITAGHIFDTDCKKGLSGRGLDFLKNICQSVDVPVYAIGGISGENIALVRQAGAKGACVMSGIMACNDVETYLGDLR